MIDHVVALADGRDVTVAESGDPDGRPVLFLHGAGSCRLEAPCFDAAGRAHGVRFLAVDRPGRISDDPPTAGPTAYAREVADLADRLGLDEFVITGQSNGGMFACAVGHELGDRVTKVIPINPTVPAADAAVRASLDLSARLAYLAILRFPRLIARSVVRRESSAPSGGASRDPDHHLRTAPGTAEVFAAIAAQPMSLDYTLAELRAGIVERWDFDHLDLKQPVEFFTGDRDGSLPYVRIWADALPDGIHHVFPGGHTGHMAPAVADRIMARAAAD